MSSPQHAYSTLEVHEPDPGKEAAHHNKKAFARQEAVDKEAVDKETPKVTENYHGANPPGRSFWKRKGVITIIVVLVVVVVVVVAAVLGGVLGSRHHNSKSSSTPAVPSTPSPNATATPVLVDIPHDSKIAAVSWNTTDQMGEFRLFYQDKDGNLCMLGRDSSTTAWSTETLTVAAKTGSALAAAVSQSVSLTDVQINLFYTDAASQVQEQIWTSGTNKWNSGTVNAEQLSTLPTSSLAALWHQCAQCSDSLILYYQNSSNYVLCMNYTSAWEVELSGQPFYLDAVPGTGLASQPQLIPGYPNQVNLYYQNASGTMCLCSWHSAEQAATNGGSSAYWNPFEQTYFPIDDAAPIAVASYGEAPTGAEDYIQLMWSNTEGGLEVRPWSGMVGVMTWLSEAQPPVMASVEPNSPVAVTKLQTAYAIQEGHIVEFQVADDGITWTSLGNVTVHHSAS